MFLTENNFFFQRGWQRWVEILYGSYLLFRALETRDAQRYGENDARSWEKGKQTAFLESKQNNAIVVFYLFLYPGATEWISSRGSP